MKSREEIEEILDSCYSLKRIKRIIKSMLMCSDITQIGVLKCKENCAKGKDCYECFMNKFLDIDTRLQKLDLLDDQQI